MQSLYKCKNYTPNENMNKTCKNFMMCRIYYGETCADYQEKETACQGIDCAWCVEDCKEIK